MSNGGFSSAEKEVKFFGDFFDRKKNSEKLKNQEEFLKEIFLKKN